MCPECHGEVPLAVQECPLCEYVFEDSSEPIVHLSHEDFIMKEVDLLKKKSPFLWVTPLEGEKTLLATRFNAWGGIFFYNNRYVALGALAKQDARVLAVGEQNVCLSVANDFMNTHESEKTAHKAHDWLYLPPSESQLKWLPEHRENKELNRYKASNLITLKFNTPSINKALKESCRAY
jgi:hypothetical protein